MKVWKDARRYTASDRGVDLSNEADTTPLPPSLPSNNDSRAGLPSKLTQIPPSESLLGSTAYRLSCAEAPKESLSDQSKYHLASLGGGVAYRTLLKRAVNETETDMKAKISPPTGLANLGFLSHLSLSLFLFSTFLGNEYTKKIESAIPPEPPRNLVVIDVHVTIPPEDLPSSATGSQTGHSKSERRTSRLQSNAGHSLAKLHAKATKLTVETHQVLITRPFPPSLLTLFSCRCQVIGIFSTVSDKPPASLDTSLFTWQQLLKISSKYSSLREIMKSPQTGLFSEENEFERSPSPQYHSSGLSSLAPLPTINSSRQAVTPNNSKPAMAVDMGATHTIKFSTPITDETVHWTAVTPESGVYAAKVSIGGGLDLQVRLVGKPPEREYLEKTIPKKIRKWVGLRY